MKAALSILFTECSESKQNRLHVNNAYFFKPKPIRTRVSVRCLFGAFFLIFFLAAMGVAYWWANRVRAKDPRGAKKPAFWACLFFFQADWRTCFFYFCEILILKIR